MNNHRLLLSVPILILVLLGNFVAVSKASAAEINGKVIATRGDSVKIKIDAGPTPSIGDKVEISFGIGEDKVPVGTWRVTKIEGSNVSADVVSKDGDATLDMNATIFSSSTARKQPQRKKQADVLPSTEVTEELPLRKPSADSPEQQYDAALGYYNKGEYVSAVRLAELAANRGNLDAHSLMGHMYEQGKGVHKDYREAIKWYRAAAGKGNALAQYYMGRMYGLGRGVSQDHQEAEKWMRKSAEQENDHAQYLLGMMYLTGNGVPKDEQQAIQWYTKAARQGNKDAQEKLIERGISWDKVTSAELLERQYQIANESFKQENYITAKNLSLLGATQGHAKSQYLLGLMYSKGKGVQQDYSKAAKWSDQGN